MTLDPSIQKNPQPVQNNQNQPLARPVDDDDTNTDTRNNFSKAVNKPRSKGEDEELSQLIAAFGQNDEEEKPSSIFGLSKTMNTPKKVKEGPIKDTLSKGQSKPDLAGIVTPDDISSTSDTDEDGKNDNSNSNMNQNQSSDLSQFIQTSTQTVSMNTVDSTPSQNAANTISRQDAIDLAQQMIEKMTQTTTEGITSTTLTLKFPPLFEGASVTIKEANTAKGQFNINFENLSPQAKALVDQQQSRDTLIQTLQEKGYNVHIIIATTDIERPEYKQDMAGSGQKQQQGQDQGQQQQQKNK